MKTSIQISLLYALLLSVHCQDAMFGMIAWNPRVPDNDPTCFISVSAVPSSAGYILQQSYRERPSASPSQIPSICHYFNFIFKSLFHGETVNSELAWQNSTDLTNFVINATFDVAHLTAMNGSACVLIPQTQWTGVDQYLCKMLYDTMPVYLTVLGSWSDGAFVFDTTTQIPAYWPLMLDQDNSPTMQANWLGANATFPAIVASLFDSCGSNTNVSSLTSVVTVTTAIDLTANLPGMWLAYTLIKAKGAAAGTYKTVVSQSNATLFDTSSSSNCWSMGIHYSDLLSDMNYCAGGCEVSFVLATNVRHQFYVLETPGLWTVVPSTGGDGNTGGDGSSGNGGSGNGGNNGSVGNGGSGNGNGGTVVGSSGLSLGASLIALIFAIVSMHWF